MHHCRYLQRMTLRESSPLSDNKGSRSNVFTKTNDITSHTITKPPPHRKRNFHTFNRNSPPKPSRTPEISCLWQKSECPIPILRPLQGRVSTHYLWHGQDTHPLFTVMASDRECNVSSPTAARDSKSAASHYWTAVQGFGERSVPIVCPNHTKKRDIPYGTSRLC